MTEAHSQDQDPSVRQEGAAAGGAGGARAGEIGPQRRAREAEELRYEELSEAEKAVLQAAAQRIGTKVNTAGPESAAATRAEVFELMGRWAAESVRLRTAQELREHGRGQTTVADLINDWNAWLLTNGIARPRMGGGEQRALLIRLLQMLGLEYVKSGRYFGGIWLG